MNLDFVQGPGENFPGVHPLAGGWLSTTPGSSAVFFLSPNSAAQNADKTGVALQFDGASITKQLTGLTIGSASTLTFFTAYRTGFTGGHLVIRLDGNIIAQITPHTVASVDGYSSESFTFTATATSHTLAIAETGANSIIFISGLTDGAVVPPPIPIPIPVTSPSKIAFIGDSLTAGTLVPGHDPVGQCGLKMLAMPGTASTLIVLNNGQSGTNTDQWANNPAFLAPILSSGATVAHVMLGTNDCLLSLSAPVYGANIKKIADTLVAAGIKAIISYPPLIVNNDPANTLLRGYYSQIDSILNGQTILRGDRSFFRFMLANPALFIDGIHPNLAGSDAMAGFWASVIYNSVL